jgi:hypothetical protein
MYVIIKVWHHHHTADLFAYDWQDQFHIESDFFAETFGFLKG